MTPLIKFSIFAFLQFVSTLGSYVFSTGISLWVFGQSASVVQYSILLSLTAIPAILILPFSGAFADRISTRKIIFFGDFSACVSSVVFLVLYFNGFQSIELVYAATILSSVFSSLQYPATVKALVAVVPVSDLNRANSWISSLDSLKLIAGPFLAVFVLSQYSVPGLIYTDILTFACSLVSLLFISGGVEKVYSKFSFKNLILEWKAGLSVLKSTPFLLSLIMFSAIFNFLDQAIIVLIYPYLLSMTSIENLGVILSFVGSGALLMGFITAYVGNRVDYFYAMMVSFTVVSVSNIYLPLFTDYIYAAIILFIGVMFVSSGYTFMQTFTLTRVSSDQIGKISSLRSIVTNFSTPAGYLFAGTICELFFESSLQENGILSKSWVSEVFKTGPGRGTGLLIFILGVIQLGSLFYLSRRIRKRQPSL